METQLLEKFHRGECSPEEVKQVLQWFKSKEPDAVQEQELLAHWNQTTQQANQEANLHDAGTTWNNILANIAPAETAPELEETNVISMTDWLRHNQYKVAAAILLPFCCLGLLLYFLANTSPATTTIATLPGEKKTITLEDGSVITLNAGSEVSYPEHFPSDKREIVLKGEAFFEVAKDSLRPFTVRTGAIVTQALGTSFNIRYMPEDSTIAVALATGRVRIDQQGQQQQALARLEPGQQLVYNKQKQRHRLAPFDTREVIGWKDGMLFFRKATLPQVISKLEYWYGVDIAIEGEIPSERDNWHYTGEYDNEDLEHVLEGISFVKQFSYQQKDKNKIIISFNN
ncbi:DUF4974 domain-containing protein [Pontibacter qinzhouensis]|uniref:DUF4974 domain-containing protein n=1 Tax=Pontibacter qinzhouensis TaxID=2603253 RepID=A0A5C8JIW8_9BACT|nr:FecR family protein [Pontibacter qinzhouensis]TXK36527.1 DUF4974 domain-containing protein [Pontibacter qinzhouensis]